MNTDIAISVKNVSKTFRIPHEKVSSLRGAFTQALKGKTTYEEFKALDDVSFEVKKGEFFGIIGRNGSGKSTLLKVLAGIYQADKGTVHIDGLISPFLELGIGFNPELSGRDNVYLNATVLGLTQKEIDAKFDDIVRFSELERFIDQKLKNYSSGMQVRLAFSVSIHANRDILLMDEVLAVGDSNFQSKCLEEFNKYREMGRTVILVSHDISTIQRYCDRAMLLRNGKVEMIGDPQQVGNEYIEQNMSDEERRMVVEEKQRQAEIVERGSRQSIKEEREREELKKIEKNRAAKLTRVEFRDRNGKVKNAFKTGEDIVARVYFEILRDFDKKFNFGIALFDAENHYLLGINTFLDEIDTSKYCEEGFFEVRYNEIPLRSNSYFVKAGIWGEQADKAVDFLNASQVFKIFSSSKNDGMIDLNYNWQ